jgi:hypothetical protein
MRRRPEALAAIGARPAARPSVSEADTPVDGWTVEVGEPAAAVEVWRSRGSWEDAFVAAKGQRPGRMSRPLSCAAREIGRYFLAHEARPPHELERFLLGACGVWSPEVGFQTLSGPVPAGTTDEALLRQARGELERRLLVHLPARATEVGFAAERQGEKMVVAMVFAASNAELAPFSLVPDADGNSPPCTWRSA